MIKYLPIAGLFLFSSCFAQKKAKSSDFEYGMTRPEVLKTIKKRNEFLLGEFNHPRGNMKVYQYGLIGKMEAQQDRYYLYYMNDTLIGRSEPGDLKEGVKTAVEKYYKDKVKREQEMAKQEEKARQREAEKLEREAKKQEQEVKKQERAAQIQERKEREAELREERRNKKTAK